MQILCVEAGESVAPYRNVAYVELDKNGSSSLKLPPVTQHYHFYLITEKLILIFLGNNQRLLTHENITKQTKQTNEKHIFVL